MGPAGVLPSEALLWASFIWLEHGSLCLHTCWDVFLPVSLALSCSSSMDNICRVLRQVSGFRKRLEKVVGDKHEEVMARMGAIMATGACACDGIEIV